MKKLSRKYLIGSILYTTYRSHGGKLYVAKDEATRLLGYKSSYGLIKTVRNQVCRNYGNPIHTIKLDTKFEGKTYIRVEGIKLAQARSNLKGNVQRTHLVYGLLQGVNA